MASLYKPTYTHQRSSQRGNKSTRDLVRDGQKLFEVPYVHGADIQALKAHRYRRDRFHFKASILGARPQAKGRKQVAVFHWPWRKKMPKVDDVGCTLELDLWAEVIGRQEQDPRMKESVLVEIPHGVEEGETSEAGFPGRSCGERLHSSDHLDVLGTDTSERGSHGFLGVGDLRLPVSETQINRERVVARRRLIVVEDQLLDEMIESTSGVVDEISDQHAPGPVRLVLKINRDPTVSTRIKAKIKNIGVGVQVRCDGVLESLEMKRGSFQLQTNSTEISAQDQPKMPLVGL